MVCLTVFSVVIKILLFFPLIYAFCGHDRIMSWSMHLEGRSWLALLVLLGASIMLLGGLVDSFLTYMSPAKRIADCIIDEDFRRIVKKPREGNQHDNRKKGNKDEDMQDGDVEIDENLYSRQLAIYGRETMRRLFNSSVLITGVGGLGAEVAKNLVLAGVKSVVLHDMDAVEIRDLSSNFLLTEDDIGKNRAVASLDKLQELNTSVEVSAWPFRISKEDLSCFQAVVFTEISLERAIEFDDYCRSQNPPIAFIKGEIRGVFGSVFCDFGPKFTVFDAKGEEPHTGIIAHISNENPAFVSCVEDERLDFQDGDMVIFTEVEGMTELNDGKPRKIKSVKPYGFILEEDTTKFGSYKKGGTVTEVFQPKELHFKPLKEALEDPGEIIPCDFSKHDRPFLLHLAFQALDKFVSEFLRFPVAGSMEDASKIVSFANSINEDSGSHKPDNIDEKVLRIFSSGSRAVLNPMAAMFGGIIGQEVVKACSAKFHPIFQFFYFDSVESLPLDPLRLEDVMPQNCRYDAQISVFGREMQQKLEESKIFIVGAGALGCEFLKNLALMGACCGGQGKLIITDDDVIERSNLNRQFLFRDWNIGQHKSTIAASAARKINPSLQIEALQNRVSSESENIFNDAFWENLEIVISGLDNVDARLYVDSRCVYFQKPLLESGTLGTKCHTQMVIPNLTENYGASRDPPEKETPLCTIHSFPHNIDHCLTWARSEFEGLFEKTPADANSFLEKPEEFKKSLNLGGDMQAQTLLERILECLVSERCETFEDCVSWSRKKFEDYFVNRVKHLVHQFPENAMTSANTPFWAPPKRFPKPLQFESTDPAHLSFILAGSILQAQTYGIPIQPWATNKAELAELLKAVDVPDFHPKSEVRIVTDENTTSINSMSTDDTNINESMIQKLQEEVKKLPSGFRLNPIHFEKDDDKHVDFIVGLGNMRARNYGIPEVDKLKAKIIAGRIIPAIATTTAMATGLVCLELYKVLAGHSIEKYRNTFANLGLSIFAMAEPVPAKIIKHENLSWTLWDRWMIRENLTVQELLEWFLAKGLTAYAISCGGVFLYNRFLPKHTERLSQKVIDLVKTAGKLPSNRCRCDITVFCEDGNGNEVDIPGVTICWSKST